VQHLEGEGIFEMNELILSFDRRYANLFNTGKL